MFPLAGGKLLDSLVADEQGVGRADHHDDGAAGRQGGPQIGPGAHQFKVGRRAEADVDYLGVLVHVLVYEEPADLVFRIKPSSQLAVFVTGDGL